jgi:hypothetical protein
VLVRSLQHFLLQEAEVKKEYVLLRERLPPDLARLQALFDEHLSLNNEMIRALQKADGYGNHGGKKEEKK